MSETTHGGKPHRKAARFGLSPKFGIEKFYGFNMLDRGLTSTEIREVLLTAAAQNMVFGLLYPRLCVTMKN